MCFDIEKKNWFNLVHNPPGKPSNNIQVSKPNLEVALKLFSVEQKSSGKMQSSGAGGLISLKENTGHATRNQTASNRQNGSCASLKRTHSIDECNTADGHNKRTKMVESRDGREQCTDGVNCKNYRPSHRANLIHTTDKSWRPLFQDGPNVQNLCRYARKYGRTNSAHFEECTH